MLVLARVHVPAHLIRRGPELFLEAEIRTVARAGPLRPRLFLASWLPLREPVKDQPTPYVTPSIDSINFGLEF